MTWAKTNKSSCLLCLFIFSTLMQPCRSTVLFLKLRKLEYWCVINACKILLSSEFIEVTSWVIWALSPVCLSTVSSPFLSCSFIRLFVFCYALSHIRCFLLHLLSTVCLEMSSDKYLKLRKKTKNSPGWSFECKSTVHGLCFPIKSTLIQLLEASSQTETGLCQALYKGGKQKCSPWFSEAH